VATAAGRARSERRQSKAVAALNARSCLQGSAPPPLARTVRAQDLFVFFFGPAGAMDCARWRAGRWQAGRFRRPRCCSMCFRWHTTGGTATPFSPAFVCVRRVQVAAVETWTVRSAEEPSCREADTSQREKGAFYVSRLAKSSTRQRGCMRTSTCSGRVAKLGQLQQHTIARLSMCVCVLSSSRRPSSHCVSQPAKAHPSKATPPTCTCVS
jgi:hypothetical protein